MSIDSLLTRYKEYRLASELAKDDKQTLEIKLLERPLKFSQGKGTYSNYSRKDPFGLLIRPLITLIGVIGESVQVIHHLALAIFRAALSICTGRDKVLVWQHVFSVIRGLEAITGFFVSLFFNQLGSYLTDDAAFHMTYYETFVTKSPILHPTKLTKVDQQAAEKMTLRDLQAMSSEERKQAIRRFKISEQAKGDFLEKLKVADVELLEKITLSQFKNHPSDVNEWVLSSDKEFSEQTLSDVDGTLNSSFIEVIKLRSQKAEVSQPVEELPAHIWQLPVVQFKRLTSEQIVEIADRLPETATNLLTDSQIKGLDPANLHSRNIRMIFFKHYMPIEEQQRRVGLLSSNQVQCLLERGKKDFHFYLTFDLWAISDLQLKEVNLEGLSAYGLKYLFSCTKHTNDPVDVAIVRRRIGLVSPEKINRMINDFPAEYIQYLSTGQLLGIDLTHVLTHQRQKLIEVIQSKFEAEVGPEKWKEAANIKLSEFVQMRDTAKRQQIIEKFKLQKCIELYGEEFYLRMELADEEALSQVSLQELITDPLNVKKWVLSPDQDFLKIMLADLGGYLPPYLRGVLSRRIKMDEVSLPNELPEKASELPVVCFPLLSAEQIIEYIDELPAWIFWFLQDHQISNIDLSTFSMEEINRFLGLTLSKDLDEEKRRFALLPAEQVRHIIVKVDKADPQLKVPALGRRLSKLISDEQLEKINLKGLNGKQLDILFLAGSEDAVGRLEKLSKERLQPILGRLSKELVQAIPAEKLEGLDVSVLSGAKRYWLTPAQEAVLFVEEKDPFASN